MGGQVQRSPATSRTTRRRQQRAGVWGWLCRTPTRQHGDSEKKGDGRGEILPAAGDIYSSAAIVTFCGGSDTAVVLQLFAFRFTVFVYILIVLGFGTPASGHQLTCPLASCRLGTRLSRSVSCLYCRQRFSIHTGFP